LVRAVMADGVSLPQGYEQWRSAAEVEARMLQADGMDPIRVVIVPVKFTAWCAQRMIHLTASAREQYAKETLVRG
jgi:hypothetical protein